MISSTVFPTISEGGFGVRAGVVETAPDIPAVEVTGVEAAVVVVVAVVVVAPEVAAAAVPATGIVLKLNAPALADAIPNPGLGVVVAETAGVEAADVLAGKLRLNPPPVLDPGVGPVNEKPPEEAGVDACVAAAGVDPKSPPVDGAGVEAPNPNPLDAAAGVALADGADDGKLNPGAEAEVVVAAELAGSEKEGIAGDDMLNKEDDVGVAADDVVDPNVDAPKSEDEEAWVWLGVAVDAPNAELAAGAVVAVGVALEPKENAENGLDVAAAEDAATAGVACPPNPNDEVALGALPPNENAPVGPAVDVAGVDCDNENADDAAAKGEAVAALEDAAPNDGAAEVIPNAGVAGLLPPNNELPEVPKADDAPEA